LQHRGDDQVSNAKTGSGIDLARLALLGNQLAINST